jgi:hypothetical protein
MARVVSGLETAGRTRQVSAGKTNVSEPLSTCRKRRDVIKTGLQSLARDELGGSLPTARVVTGTKARVISAQALVRNVGTCRPDAKGEFQVVAP